VSAPLYLGAHTIQSHINRIFAKTGSADHAAAIRYARDHDIDMDRRDALTVRCTPPPADLRLPPYSWWGRPQGR
jgi:hypothetical protein